MLGPKEEEELQEDQATTLVLDYDERLLTRRMRRLLAEMQLKQPVPAFDWRLSMRRELRSVARAAFIPDAADDGIKGSVSSAKREHDRLVQEYAKESERVLTLPISTESAGNSTWDSTFSTALFLFAREALDRVIPGELAAAAREGGGAEVDASNVK